MNRYTLVPRETVVVGRMPNGATPDGIWGRRFIGVERVGEQLPLPGFVRVQVQGEIPNDFTRSVFMKGRI